MIQPMVDETLLEGLANDARCDDVQRFVVGAIVRHGDCVLLLRRSADDFMGGLLELPSGTVEPGESMDAALIREVREETGLDVIRIETYLGHFDYEGRDGLKTRQFNFVVDVASPEPISLVEHSEYVWASPKKDLTVTNAVKRVLARYRELYSM